jgi:hypothetical protein
MAILLLGDELGERRIRHKQTPGSSATPQTSAVLDLLLEFLERLLQQVSAASSRLGRSGASISDWASVL